MEKPQNFVAMNGGLNLPIGYRFRPTDEELVFHYLKRKVLSLPLPVSVIPEFDVFQIDPLALPGDAKEKRYFFCNKKKRNDDNNFSIVGQKKKACFGSGYWKPMGKDRVIVASDQSNQAVGLRRTMVFCHGRRFGDINTRWFMHEYHLVRSGPTPNSFHLISPVEMKEYWVICGVFQKKRRLSKSKRNRMVLNRVRSTCDEPSVMDFIVEEMSNSGPTTPTMSCSSGITEVSSNDLVDGNDDAVDQEQNSDTNVSCFRDDSCN